jgi:nuclear pore complex protein Nup155
MQRASTPWSPFQKVRVHQIPDQIFDQLNRANVSMSMGLFAELHHAWVTIDNALYMWDYTIANPELLGFEGQPHVITAVKIAVPRIGVFLPSIKNIIVIATISEVILLGLGTDSGPGGSTALTLFNTGMSTSVRGLDVRTITTSDKSGRIFFGGTTENDVYELTYQQEDRWFSSKCAAVCHTRSRIQLALNAPISTFASGLLAKATEHVEQMVIDDSRDCLYTLSSTSAIRTFRLSADGSANLTVTMPRQMIYVNVGHCLPPSSGSNDSLNPQTKIVSISPISSQESTSFRLVATTATGYRIYFSGTNSHHYYNQPSLQATHVKTPPVTDPPAPAAQYSGQSTYPQIQQAPPALQGVKTLTVTQSAQRYTPGYYFCFFANDPNSPNHTVFISAPDAGRLARPLEAGQPSKSSETAMTLDLGSRAEDIGICTKYSAPTSSPPGYANDLAVQFDAATPEVAVLTNTGIHIIKRRRLVDVFASLIQHGGGSEGFAGDVNDFIRTYGRTETLATALAVACGQGMEVTPDARSTRINDPEVLEVARKTFIDYGGKPSYNENTIADRSVQAIDTVRPSPRHGAIAVYVCRLLRSTWKSPIARENRTPTEYSVFPAVPLAKLRSVQEELSALQRFFKANKSFIQGLSGPDEASRTGSKNDEVAMQGEHRALFSLVKFITDTIEAISFVLVLFDERVSEIVPLLPEQSRPQFFALTFEGLFSTTAGFSLAKELVKAIVNRNIAKGSNVETVAEALRRRCGSFCSAEDVIIFKAQEQLKRASEAGANAEFARNLLNESLNLFQQAAEILPRDYLDSAVRQFTVLQFFAGAIQLVLKVAHEKDKANEALSWMSDGRPDNDSRRAKFDERALCYDLLHDVINAVDQSIANGPSFVEGRPTLTATRRNEAYDVISRAKDEVFLTNLYDWYVSEGWYDRLLATDSTFIATYLQRKSTIDVMHADLLWKYYGQSSQFADAARVQLQLARSGFDLTLEKRIEYLSRARANASTYTQGGSRKAKQKLLQEITELLDVANLQDEILSKLKDDRRFDQDPVRRQDVLKRVDGPIMSINDLFNDYADNAGYYDVCLQVYQVADHRDTSQINQTWQQAIEQEHAATIGRTDDGAPEPFEAVAELVRSLGNKLQMSESTFPVHFLLPLLQRYSFQHQRAIAPAHWVIDLFLELQVAYERVFDVLEMMFYSNEIPFTGMNRKPIAQDLLYVIQRWLHDTTRGGAMVFDSEEGALRVDQTLQDMLQGGRSGGMDDAMMQICRLIREQIAMVLH